MKNSVLEEKKIFEQAIKTVGVGKRGSRNMPADLVRALGNDIKQEQVPSEALGAILGALSIKGLSNDEVLLADAFKLDIFKDPKSLVETLCENTPDEIKMLCVKLSKGEILNCSQAEVLGDYLFSTEDGNGLRGLAASIMRVRYESNEEYCGLIRSITKTFDEKFNKGVPDGFPIIQMAEPFDGVDHSSMITPLVAQHLQKLNYRVVNLIGRSSGPKTGINLFDIAQTLNAHHLKDCTQIDDKSPPFGFYLNQADLSAALDRWVEIRRVIIKRPFLATIERFVNPFSADIFIASAFHPPYGEKMLKICEDQKYPAAIIVRNGIEGGIAFPLLRPAKILMTVRLKNGDFARHDFEYDSQKELQHDIRLEEKLKDVSAHANASLILEYQKNGNSQNELFNMRTKATCLGLQKALEWINQQ